MFKSDFIFVASYAVLGYLVWEDWYTHERFWMCASVLYTVALLKWTWGRFRRPTTATQN